jgi:sortase B
MKNKLPEIDKNKQQGGEDEDNVPAGAAGEVNTDTADDAPLTPGTTDSTGSNGSNGATTHNISIGKHAAPTAVLPLHAAANEGNRKGSRLSLVLLILGILLIAAALAIAGFLVFRYMDAQNRYNEISSVAGLEITIEDGVIVADKALSELVFNWDELRATNPDVVAWIIVPGTRISYPIVQGPDNDYYLHHLFDSTYSDVGAAFLDSECSPTYGGRNNITYGHNVFDGSMFAEMNSYVKQDFFDENNVVYLCTPTLNYELRPFATLVMGENSPLRNFDIRDETSLLNYINTMMDYAVVHDNSKEASSLEDIAKKSVFSFVTCDTVDYSQRVVLICEPVRSVAPAGSKS